MDETDKDWVDRFASGVEWWCHEVTDFLRNDALEHGKQGLNATTLFSFPGYREIVGFLTAATGNLPAADVKETINLPPGVPARLPAILIPYMGVAHNYRRVGHFGQEMHTQLLNSLGGSWAGSRVIYIECWEENDGGVAFWRKLGYVQFHRKRMLKPDESGQAWLLRMVYDRFAIRADA